MVRWRCLYFGLLVWWLIVTPKGLADGPFPTLAACQQYARHHTDAHWICADDHLGR